MKSIKLIFCRHTNTNLNVEHRYTGHLDVPLNAIGETQAQQLAEMFRCFKISAIFSSDLKRAAQTALAISVFHPDLIVQQDLRLREVNLGKLNGMLKTEVKQQYPNKKFSTRYHGFDFTEVGGETRHDVIRRQREFFEELVKKVEVNEKKNSYIVIVGHGTALRVFFEDIGAPCMLEQGNYQFIIFTV